MAELGARIREVLSQKGLTQAQLARLVGVKQQTISYICAADSPASTSRYATKIAQVLGVNPSWLQSGEGGQHDLTVRIELEGVELTVRRVPLINNKDVAALLDGRITPDSKAGLMTDANVGKRSFAVEIEGDSMRPLFRPGDRIVVDPDLLPEPGDFVVAHAQGAVTFRKYRARGNDLFELAPLNDDWPVIKSELMDIKIVGVMVEHRSYRNRK
jgi:SOS-response transcriptional repressor LexA